jgi:hypothetical protein
MAGQPNNTNSLTHGLTAVLTSGRLPKGCSYIRKTCAALKMLIEGQVLSVKGEVSLVDAATIQSCIRWERHALLSQRWLRTEAGLNPDQKLSFSREIARASAERDKCLRLLQLDKPQDAFQTLLDSFAESEPVPQPDAVAGVVDAPGVPSGQPHTTP